MNTPKLITFILAFVFWGYIGMAKAGDSSGVNARGSGVQHHISASIAALCLALAACAGRAPNPVATVNPTDSMMDCFAIQSEIQANN